MDIASGLSGLLDHLVRGRWTIPSSRSSLVGVLDTVLTTGLHGRSVVREEVPEQVMSKTVRRRGGR